MNWNQLQHVSLKASRSAQNRGTAKQIELSESTHPLLIAYLQYLRKINGIHNKMDDLNKNSHMLKEFHYLCEHNLLFFLRVTGQFDALKELFKGKKKLRRMISVLHQFKKHKKAVSHQKYLLFASLIFAGELSKSSIGDQFSKIFERMLQDNDKDFLCEKEKMLDNLKGMCHLAFEDHDKHLVTEIERIFQSILTIQSSQEFRDTLAVFYQIVRILEQGISNETLSCSGEQKEKNNKSHYRFFRDFEPKNFSDSVKDLSEKHQKEDQFSVENEEPTPGSRKG